MNYFITQSHFRKCNLPHFSLSHTFLYTLLYVPLTTDFPSQERLFSCLYKCYLFGFDCVVYVGASVSYQLEYIGIYTLHIHHIIYIHELPMLLL